jgi:osmoprotectant transport system ATP-binding protein
MIRIENLSKVFNNDQNKAVDSVTFTLEMGTIGCIIGTSGCGKTTTLKMINRLIEPSEGRIWVEENEASQMDAVQWRRKIGYVIQKAGLLPHLTVAQNISLLSTILKKDKTFIKDRVQELMHIINMPYEKFHDRYPAEISGGQQQRVGIARALMENPPVLLMDEPFGALDPITRKALHEELISLNQKLHKTILIVTHDMTEAFKLADKIILMNAGKLVQMGTKNDFIQNPKNEFVENFFKGQIHE